MKKQVIFSLALVLVFTIASKSQDSNATRIVNRNLDMISQSVKHPAAYSEGKVRSAVRFLEKLTGVYSEADGDFIGQKPPTAFDLLRWQRWFAFNKNYLSWDPIKRVIVLTKEVNVYNSF